MIKYNDSNVFPLELYHLSNFHLVQAILPKIQQTIHYSGERYGKVIHFHPMSCAFWKGGGILGHAESQSNIQGKCSRCKFSSQPQVSNPGSNKMAGEGVFQQMWNSEVQGRQNSKDFFLTKWIEGEKKNNTTEKRWVRECQPRHGSCSIYLDFAGVDRRNVWVFHLQSMPFFRESFTLTWLVRYCSPALRRRTKKKHLTHVTNFAVQHPQNTLHANMSLWIHEPACFIASFL